MPLLLPPLRADAADIITCCLRADMPRAYDAYCRFADTPPCRHDGFRHAAITPCLRYAPYAKRVAAYAITLMRAAARDAMCHAAAMMPFRCLYAMMLPLMPLRHAMPR